MQLTLSCSTTSYAILGLEGTTTKNFQVLTLDNFPHSYILLISVSSTPISFYLHLVLIGHQNEDDLLTIFLLEPTVVTIMLEDSSESIRSLHVWRRVPAR